MAIKKIAEYEHGNANLAFADSDFVRGGGRVVADLNALYQLSSKSDQLKQDVTIVFVTSENAFYVLSDDGNIGNATGWTDIGTIISAAGATGPTGPTGVAGANGVDGARGATGPTGAAGANGVDGDRGATGPTGAAGANGLDGARGATGPTGDAGANGLDGARGATGPTGAAGTNGIDGTDGATGARGATGPTGPVGPIGDLSDVSITGVADKQILEYDSVSSEWVNVYLDHSYVRVYNNTSSAMSRGDVVYISAAQNADVAQVSLAKADSASTMPAIGVLYDSIAIGAEGLAVVNGKANGIALPTASFSEGDVVYVSGTVEGGVTATKPTGTNLIQNLGIVMQAHNTNGTIKVTGVGRSNDVPNIPNGQAWIGNASGVATPTTLATVATSGDYNDLSNTPSIPTGTVNTITDGVQTVSNPTTVEFGSLAGTWNITESPSGTAQVDLELAARGLTDWSSIGAANGDVVQYYGGNYYPTQIEGATGINYNVITPANSSAPSVSLSVNEAELNISNMGGTVTSYSPTTSGISSNGDASGEIVYIGNSSDNLTAGQVYYYNGSGSWVAIDADADSTSKGLLGVAMGTDPTSSGVLIRGFAKVTSNLGTPGAVVYASTTAGTITETAPTATNDIVRVVGYTIDSTNDIIYFNPDKTWIELG